MPAVRLPAFGPSEKWSEASRPEWGRSLCARERWWVLPEGRWRAEAPSPILGEGWSEMTARAGETPALRDEVWG